MIWESGDSKNVKGEQRIVSLKSPDQVKIEMIFEQPIRSNAEYRFELTSIGDASTLLN